jgi:hypothetical protein
MYEDSYEQEGYYLDEYGNWILDAPAPVHDEEGR